MERSLGLDIGTNSIGWAVVELNENAGQIVGAGVYIFPEGVENLGKGEREISRNAQRRGARQRRRQLFRKKLRKRALLKLLGEHGLCPILSDEELRQWQKTGAFPDREDIRAWLLLNPYILRDRAVRQQLTLYEIGRIFYHLAQRRGFPSKSRSAASSEQNKIERGDPKLNKPGIEQTRQLIESDTHAPTLGAALAKLYSPDNQPYRYIPGRIRNRYTDRQWYIDEFEKIWEFQEQFYPDVLTAELKAQIGGRRKDGYPCDGVLFFQSPLRSQKHLVGRCTFEPSKPRCLKSHPLYERFTIAQFVANLRCNDEPLTREERDAIIKLMLSSERVTISKIREKLGKTASDYVFNFDDNDSNIPRAPLNAKLSSKKIFGPAWLSKSPEEQHRIWHALQSFDNIDMLAKHAQQHFGLSAQAAAEFARIKLKQEYGPLSLKAIRLILPFLEQGYTYPVATALAGVRRAMGARWEALSDSERTELCDKVEGLVTRHLLGGYTAKLAELLSEYGLTERDLRKLYHHSQPGGSKTILQRIPTDAEFTARIMSIRNPVVISMLFALRRIVNELLERYGSFDCAVVELARELKLSKTKRAELQKQQAYNQRIREAIKEKLEEQGIKPTDENILKYRLWLECGMTCPYSGRPISFEQLFNGQVQIEHIVPYSRSLDNSFRNLTLCFADINRDKGDRTPYEYFISKYGNEQWEKVKQRLRTVFINARKWDKDDPLSYFPDRKAKYERFIAEHLPVDDFVNRQLNDTRIASVYTRDMLQHICSNVITSQGQATALLRDVWIPRSPLDNDKRSVENLSKSRDDHRHHALDAIVLACIRRRHIQQLSTLSAKQNSFITTRTLRHLNQAQRIINPPWPSFQHDVDEALQSTVVVYHRFNRVLTRRTLTIERNGRTRSYRTTAARKQLHNETFYGKHIDPSTGREYFHVRKPLSEIKDKHDVNCIVDPVIRQLVEQRIEECGGYENDGTVPDNAFFTTTPLGTPQPHIFLRNRRGEPVPVLKVRLRYAMANARQHRDGCNRYVDPSNNHHAIIYRLPNGNLDLSVVQFWDAVLRKLRGEPLYQAPPGCEVIMTLHINDMVLLGCPPDLLEHIFRTYPPDQRGKYLAPYIHKVQKLSMSERRGFELCFRHHTDARLSEEAKESYILIRNWGTGKQGWFTYNPVKLRISPSGCIERWS